MTISGTAANMMAAGVLGMVMAYSVGVARGSQIPAPLMSLVGGAQCAFLGATFYGAFAHCVHPTLKAEQYVDLADRSKRNCSSETRPRTSNNPMGKHRIQCF